jgi:hypothetical protein
MVVGWWPRSLRRSDDLWDRLPASIRRVHNTVLGLTAVLLVDILVVLLWLAAHPRIAHAVGPALIILTALLAIWTAAEPFRAGYGLRLGLRDLSELLALPTISSHPGWSKPKFARLLVQDAVDPSAPPKTPEELTRSIRALNDRLRQAGVLADLESARAAESVRVAIAALDEEVGRLDRELDPSEGERLDRRLALASGDEELRRLLESQRAVWQRLAQRRDESSRRRDRLRDQLMTLLMQLLELEMRARRGAPADADLTGRVHALCAELARAGEAMVEADRVLAAPDSRSSAGRA